MSPADSLLASRQDHRRVGSPAVERADDRQVRLLDLGRPLAVLAQPDGSTILADGGAARPAGAEAIALIPAVAPGSLGSAAFRRAHGVRLAYMAGAMAGGIASEDMVVALGRAGVLASFGAAGLDLARIEAAVTRLKAALPEGPWAINLIHTPERPDEEMARVALFRRAGVTTVEASAFMELSPAVVAFRAGGLSRAPDGQVRATTRVIAKLSHPRVAEQFLSPPPAALLETLVAEGTITAEQAHLAAGLPVAGDITVEADSGGHTDRRPLVGLLPAMLRLRDRLQRRHGYAEPPRIGAAGGIGTPDAVAAAFAQGADYVVSGSINQACREAGTSEAAKAMLAEAGFDDLAMAPAADMFELGVQVQVLKRGTLFAQRAQRLWELYRGHDGWEAIAEADRARIERDLFRRPADEIWADCERYLAGADPQALAEARRDGKRKLGLLFRWYLGLSSRWANAGEAERRADYQLWCGPAMAAFNDWSAGSRFAEPAGRGVVEVAEALMRGAAYLTRLGQLRCASPELSCGLAGAEPDLLLAQAESARMAEGPSTAAEGAKRPASANAEPEAPEAPHAEAPHAEAPHVEAPHVEAPHAEAIEAEAIEAWLIEEIARALGVAPEEIDPRRSFESYALDSVKALAVMGRLEQWLGRKLSPTLVWNYPTIEALAERLGGPR